MNQQNVEFKAELRDMDAAREQCRQIGAVLIGQLRQTDVYFRMPEGRLKRRTAPGEPVEWILYHRPDTVSPKVSDYTIMSEEQARRRWGTLSLREWVTVVKTRELWMLEGVRIHLDDVVGLGQFIECEAMVSPEFEQFACENASRELIEIFAPCLGEMVAVSYADMVAGV